jgi:signal transduction histidine kinase
VGAFTHRRVWFPEFVTSHPRIAILPRQVASEVITTAVARGGWGVAIVLVALDYPVVIEMLVSRGLASALPIPLAALTAMLVLIVVVGGTRTVVKRVLYILGAVLLSTVYIVALLRADPSLNVDATYVVNRPAIVLVLLSPFVMRPLRGLAWSSLGLLLSVGVIVAGCLLVGEPIITGWGPYTAWAVYAIAWLVLSLIRATQASAVPDLSRLEDETRRMALESQFEQRAAAMIHDTVLSDLTAIMNATGELDERARERFRADVATLKNPSWLRVPTPAAQLDERDAELRNGAISLASEMQWRGLTVDLTGTNDAVVKLSSAATAAVLDALRACLENVLAHSGATSAQLVAGGNEHEITYMVIDNGVGFDPSAVPTSRLGLRTSVVGRIEANGGSVRVWSQPGSGTSVLISMPTSVVEVEVETDPAAERDADRAI